jgi:hypothetical protein
MMVPSPRGRNRVLGATFAGRRDDAAVAPRHRELARPLQDARRLP